MGGPVMTDRVAVRVRMSLVVDGHSHGVTMALDDATGHTGIFATEEFLGVMVEGVARFCVEMQKQGLVRDD